MLRRRVLHPFHRHAVLPAASRASPGDRVEALKALCRRLAVIDPTVELTEELWPSLAQALADAGFRAIERHVLMVLPSKNPTPCFPSTHARSFELHTDAGADVLRQWLEGVERAQGGEANVVPAEVEALRAALAEGSVRASTILWDGAPSAGAALIGGGLVRELAGVWTARHRRRQGWATACCARLLTTAIQHEGEQNSRFNIVWLAAAPDAVGMYRRLGFAPIGTRSWFEAELEL